MKTMISAACRYCLAVHTEEAGCSCFRCNTPLHPQFLVCRIIDGERRVLCPSCAEQRSITREDLMELVDYVEQRDGTWKASLCVPGQVKLMLKAGTLPKVTKAMEELCDRLVLQIEARALDAEQAAALMRMILSDGK